MQATHSLAWVTVPVAHCDTGHPKLSGLKRQDYFSWPGGMAAGGQAGMGDGAGLRRGSGHRPVCP